MGRRHAGYGVTDEHYDTVASALLWTNAACIMIGEKLAGLVRADPAVNPASYEEVLYG
jgi:hemoglobin-like flavoprotein